MQNLKVGLDLGGTKIEIIVLSSNGKTLLRERCPTPSHHDYPVSNLQYEQIIESIKRVIHQSEAQFNQSFQHIGIGIPGAISPSSGLVKNANTTCLIGRNFKSDLEQALHKTVNLANDADCFTLSEAIDGAGKGFNSVFGVIIGTGCGGGLVFNQKLISGPNAIAGEWGHNPLPWSEKEDQLMSCYCGKSGCIETFLSGPGFSQQAFNHCGERINSKEWHKKLIEKDALAIQVFERYSHHLAKSLASVINILDPEVIVLGGGMSNIEYLYQRTQEILPDYVFSDQVLTQIVKAKFGDSSGVRGAAWL